MTIPIALNPHLSNFLLLSLSSKAGVGIKATESAGLMMADVNPSLNRV